MGIAEGFVDHNDRAGKIWIVVVLALIGGLGLVGFILATSCGSRETANRVNCASNLRQIGQAILLYANGNHGAYPDHLEKLLLTQDITSEVFTCPSSNDEKALGATTQEVAANLSTKGHLSYIYVGAGLTKDSPAQSVVLYEPLLNHDEDGSNVLFADGHVEWASRKELATLIATTRPTTTP